MIDGRGRDHAVKICSLSLVHQSRDHALVSHSPELAVGPVEIRGPAAQLQVQLCQLVEEAGARLSEVLYPGHGKALIYVGRDLPERHGGSHDHVGGRHVMVEIEFLSSLRIGPAPIHMAVIRPQIRGSIRMALARSVMAPCIPV